MSRIEKLTNQAIEFIRNAEPLAMKMDAKGFHVAFSGGKDSQVLLKLFELSGVKFHAQMNVTSVDSSNLMRFVRANYPNVEMVLPKNNMRELIAKKSMLPTRMARFCCKELKEQAGAGCVTAVGVRAKESVQRAKRSDIEVIGQRGKAYEIQGEKLVERSWGGQIFDLQQDTQVYCVGGKDKVIISPIFQWSETDVWEFMAEHNLPHCDLYDKGFHRIGCLFCPMSSVNEKRRELEMFPLVAERMYKPAIKELMAVGKYDNFKDADEVFEWWISNQSAKEWLAQRDNKQRNLFED